MNEPSDEHAPAAPVDAAPKQSAPAVNDASVAPKPAANQPSPEEQMERFAQDLKENDWGHQPC